MTIIIEMQTYVVEHIADPVVQDLGYSTEELLFHQDLVYYESPPGIQLFHCVKSATTLHYVLIMHVTIYACNYACNYAMYVTIIYACNYMHVTIIYACNYYACNYNLCMYRFDECVEGGENMLLDTYPVLEEMRRTHPKQFDTLARIPVTFQRLSRNA